MARSSKRTTDRGFVNPNRQKNNGATDPPLPGSDHNQIIYKMECLVCGHRYGANGSDIWQRKCPRCQRGREGLALGITRGHES
jgi:hypothetical protein